MSRRSKRGGFTLMELMMIVTIIGILILIALPKLGGVLRRANEGQSKANLGSLRSALNIYYSDMNGSYPSDLAALTVAAKYLQAIPRAKTPTYHPDSEGTVTQVSANDAGGWSYNGILSDANFGVLWVNCTHTDLKGSVWTSY